MVQDKPFEKEEPGTVPPPVLGPPEPGEIGPPESGETEEAGPEARLPDDLDGLFVLLKRERDAEQAKRISHRIWQQWYESGSKSVDLLVHWARDASARKKYHIALDLLDQAIVMNPRYAEAWNQRATLHYTMSNFSKSMADIEKTLALEPRHFGALSGMAVILQRLDRKEEALAVWRKALTYYPAMTSAQKAVIELSDELTGRGI